MGEKYTEAQKRASIKYMQAHTDDIRLRLPKGTKDAWQAAAKDAGLSMTAFVSTIVNGYIKKQKAEE